MPDFSPLDQSSPPPQLQSVSDPAQDEINTYTHAYGLAAHAGDTAAMSELHGKLLNAYQSQTAKATKEDNASRPNEMGLAGLARGALKVGDTVNSLMGVDKLIGKSTDDDTDKGLLADKEGAVGNVAGQMLATAPVGSAGGLLTKALGASKLAAPGLATTLGRVGARAAIGGGENAAASALGGEDTGEGARVGAGASVALGAAGRLAKGVVGKSDAAQRLYDDAAEEGKDIFIPISQGGTGPAKSLYQNALPYALGVEGKLQKQSAAAKNVMSEVAAEHGMPAQVDNVGRLNKTPAPVGETTEQTAADMRGTYDKAYDNTVKSYAFKPPDDFHSSVLGNLADSGLPSGHKQQIAATLDNVVKEFSDADGTLTGENLLRAKAAGRDALGSLRSPSGNFTIGNPSSTEKALGSFDDVVQDAIDEHKAINALPPKQAKAAGLSPKDQESARLVANDLENFQKLGPAYASGNAFASTAESNIANRGEINFGKLASNSPPTSPMRSLAQDAHEVLERESAGGVNPAGRHFLHTAGLATAPLAVAALGHPGIAAMAIGGGNLLATKGVQKGLYGDTATQQAIARMLRANPQLAHQAGFAATRGALDAQR